MPTIYQFHPIIKIFLFVASFSQVTGCKAPKQQDPQRCAVREAGEAANLLGQVNLPNDSMVRVQGITHPQALVWQDKEQGTTHYATRVMGTEKRVFYLKTISQGERPQILSELTGHLIRWDQLPDKRMKPVAAALKKQYHIAIEPDQTYVIDADGRPEGCPAPPN